MTAEIITLANVAPLRRRPPAPLGLGTRVLARPHGGLTAHGAIAGLAYADPPRYDVRLDNGRWFNNLPADQVEAL